MKRALHLVLDPGNDHAHARSPTPPNPPATTGSPSSTARRSKAGTRTPKKIGHGTGGKWTVEPDGVLAGEQDPPGSGNGGILLTDRKFGDFELSLEMKPSWGVDSGLFLRATDKGECIQMTVDYYNGGNIGHFYGEATGGWLARAFSLQGEETDGKLVALKTIDREAAVGRRPRSARARPANGSKRGRSTTGTTSSSASKGASTRRSPPPSTASRSPCSTPRRPTSRSTIARPC